MPVVIAAAIAALPVAVCAQLSYETIALSGQRAPGTPDGVVYDDLNGPVLSSSGHLGFLTGLRGPGVTVQNDKAVFAGPMHGLRLVAREGAAAPGMPAGVSYAAIVRPPTINDRGETGFDATLQGTGVTARNDVALFTGAAGSVQPIARTGRRAGGAARPLTFASFSFTASLNDSGHTAYNTTFRGHRLTHRNDEAVYAGPITSPQLVAREGDPAPGAGPGVVFRDVGSRVFGPVIADGGHLGFTALLDRDGQAIRRAVYAGQAGDLRLVAMSGAPAPVPGGANYGTILFSPALNDDGQVAFSAAIDRSGNNVWPSAVFAGEPAALQVVAMAGDAAPGAPAGTVFSDLLHTPVSLGDGGHVAFRPMLRSGPGPLTSDYRYFHGVYSGRPGELRLIAFEGQRAPNTGPDVVYADLASYTPALNDAGQIAYETRLAGQGVTGSNDDALFLSDPALGTFLVAREGTPFDIGGGAYRTVGDIYFYNGRGDDERTGLSNDGRMGFWLRFTDGTSGVFVATVPEPSAAICAAAAASLLLSRCRRAPAAGPPARRRPRFLRAAQLLPPIEAAALEPRRLLATFTVTTTADAGPGSLRQAILEANADPGGDIIRFAFPGDLTTVHVIRPLSPLPDVTGTTYIDARTGLEPTVELDGRAAGDGADGLTLLGDGCLAMGLAIYGFSGNGIVMRDGSGIRVIRSYIGLDSRGEIVAGNGGAGVLVSSPRAMVGEALQSGRPPYRNVISGNKGPGIHVTGVPADARAELWYNYIGVSPAGDQPRPNAMGGVLIDNAVATWVGGNTIASNLVGGVRIDSTAPRTWLTNNIIGTHSTTGLVLPNRGPGVAIAASEVRLGPGPLGGGRNVISANDGPGVVVTGGADVVLTENYIGTNVNGLARLGSQLVGVQVTGAERVMIGPRNVISGQTGSAVSIEGNFSNALAVTLASNYIGTDATGTRALPNGRPAQGRRAPGIAVTATGQGGIWIEGNTVAASGEDGIRVEGTTPVSIRGNYVGTNAAGTAGLGNDGDGVVISGERGELLGNLISGNAGDGVRVSRVTTTAFSVVMQGNFVGTDRSGTSAIPNGGNGISVWNDAVIVRGFRRPTLDTSGTGNLVSGNRGHGILAVGTRGGQISGNYIGVDATGEAPLGNGGSGIYLATSPVIVGWPTGTEQANVIGANGVDGVTIAEALGTPVGRHRIQGNVIGAPASRSLTGARLGNARHGVAIINSGRNGVGRTPSLTMTVSAEEENLIAFNGGSGVAVMRAPTTPPSSAGAEGNWVGGNRFYANGGLPIDLGGDGPTPNDPGDIDAGPNRLINHPIITRARIMPTGTVLDYSFQSEPNARHLVYFYVSQTPDISGRWQLVTTSDLWTDGNGNARRSVRLEGAPVGSLYVRAAAVRFGDDANDPSWGTTSELSGVVRMLRARPPFRPDTRPPAPAPARAAVVHAVPDERSTSSLRDLLD